MEKKAEIITLAVIWLTAFLAPVLSSPDISIQDFKMSLMGLLPFFVLFLANHFFVVPKFLFKNKYVKFLLCNALLITAVFFASELLHERPPEMQPHFPKEERKPPQKRRPPFKSPVLVLSILVIGCDCGVVFAFHYIKIQRDNDLREKQDSKNKLAALKQQVSPHFFMNTLNNIHALIDIDSELAKETVIRLSKMMRYMLYDCDSGVSDLKKETDFVLEYVSLMRLRYSEDKVEILTEIPDNLPENKKIPSLIFISMIENAFKHGVSYKKKSFICVKFFVESEKLVFLCKNSLPEEPSQNKKQGGIGIKNTVNRLDLIYGKDYEFKINKDGGEFSVVLKLPLL
jgi:hypothetical protein